MKYSRDGLGQAIRDLREAKGWTQQQLGEAADYRPGTGAAVSISRVEGGYVLPGAARLAAIARALDMTLTDLEREAVEHTKSIEAGERPAGRAVQARASRRDVGRWAEELEAEWERREDRYAELVAANAAAHERALSDFYLRVVEFADDLDGFEQLPDPPERKATTAREQPGASSRFRIARGGVATVAADGARYAALGLSDQAGRLASYGTLRAVMAFGTSGTGRPNAMLHGAALDSAARAQIGGGPKWAGGGGMAQGNKRLAVLQGAVAIGVPVLLSAYAGVRRCRDEQQLTERCGEVSEALLDTARSFEAVEDLLPRATAVLDDIAVHGSRAFTRWTAKLGPEPLGFLDAANVKRLQEFLDLAACQVLAARVEAPGLMAERGADLEELVAALDEDLNYARAVVEELV